MYNQFIPCSEFRWSPEGPVSQIHSPHLLAGVPGIFSDLLRPVQLLKKEWVRKATGIYRNYPSLVKLQPWFLSLQWKTCLDRTAALVPEFAVKDLPLGRILWWWCCITTQIRAYYAIHFFFNLADIFFFPDLEYSEKKPLNEGWLDEESLVTTVRCSLQNSKEKRDRRSPNSVPISFRTGPSCVVMFYMYSKVGKLWGLCNGFSWRCAEITITYVYITH